MKTVKKILCLLLALCLSIPLFACGGAALETPAGIFLDEEYMLSWEAVEGARSYEIEIKNAASGETVASETSRRTMYSLSRLPEGDYAVRLRSVGGVNNADVSEWTEELDFHREYDSGLIYTPINNETEYMVTRVGAAQGDIVIEDEYRGKPVTAIGAAAFRSAGDRVTSVTLGKNIRTIGNSAFYNCVGLERVTMTDSVVSIGNSAFQNCTSLTTIELSSSITSIPDYAFARCISLKTFDFSSITAIGESAFTGCTGLTNVELPDAFTALGPYAFNENNALTSVTFGKNIAIISDYAFYSCDALAAVSFPEELEEGVSLAIGMYAFANCVQLEGVNLPGGTSSLGAGCFYGSSNLGEISIPDTVSAVGSEAFGGTELTESQLDANAPFIYADQWIVGISDANYQNLKEIETADLENAVGIADYAFIRIDDVGTFKGCPNLRTVRLPSSLRYIGQYAFYNTPNLEVLNSVSANGGLEVIDAYAFGHCATLTQVKFSEGLREIGEYAFMECTSLINNQYGAPHDFVPASVTRIGSYAFLNAGLWTRPENGIIYAGNWAVGYEGELGDPSLKPSVEGVSDYAFYNCTLHTLSGLYNAGHIGVGAFYNCGNLASVQLSPDLTEIAPYTFYNCVSLRQINSTYDTQIIFPDRIRSIGRYAFANCVYLGLGDEKPIDLSDCPVTEIGDRAFYGCTSLKGVNLGSVQIIGKRAFYGCTSLQEATIPGTVAEIGEAAFAKSAVASLTLEEGIQSIAKDAFRSTKVTAVHIPDTVKEIGDAAFYDAAQNLVIDLGNGVERIGNYAFGRNVNAVGCVAIPATVKEIGLYAFAECSKLSGVAFLGNVTTIGVHAFYLCPGVTFFAAEGVELPEVGWNSTFRPVVYGCTLSSGGDDVFVYSLTTGKMLYSTALGGIADPFREGYDFVGWATEPDGEKRYDTADLAGLPEGVTLYALYEIHVEEGSGEPGPSPEE